MKTFLEKIPPIHSSSNAQRHILQSRLISGAESLKLTLNDECVKRFLDYIDLLVLWNAKFNLTAVRDPLAMVTRHLLDSLSIVAYIEGRTLVDIGSGAGLPGIPLAMIAPDRRVTLVDSNGKKIRFLQEAVSVLGLTNVTVELSRIEQLKQRFDCVTARAFATLAEMLKLGGHLLAPGGIWLAQKGRYPDSELADIPLGFKITAIPKLQVPGLDAERHLVIIQRNLKE